jgi:hypothetical protein
MENTEFLGANLRDAVLDGGFFSGATFEGVRLSGASFVGADLRAADLSGATGLETADFTGANLENVVLPDGYSVVAGVLVAPASTSAFRAWARLNGVPDVMSESDRAVGGHPLLMHFALDVAPSQAIPAERLPRMERDAAGGHGVFRYAVPKTDRGVRFSPQLSTSLEGDWLEATEQAEVVGENASDTHYQISAPAGGVAAFFRLELSTRR